MILAVRTSIVDTRNHNLIKHDIFRHSRKVRMHIKIAFPLGCGGGGGDVAEGHDINRIELD